MNKKTALALVQQYVNGWKQNDLEKIISALSEACIVIESHGPTYHGINAITCWFDFWTKAKSTITQWDITSFYFNENEETSFFEWNFSCTSNNAQYSFSGISIVKFLNKKIILIHEYRMTHPAYIWKGDKLESE